MYSIKLESLFQEFGATQIASIRSIKDFLGPSHFSLNFLRSALKYNLHKLVWLFL